MNKAGGCRLCCFWMVRKLDRTGANMSQQDRPMISRKPYLLRAMVQWCEDNGLTPLIAVNAEEQDVSVPRQFVEDGRITLNISFIFWLRC